MWGIKHYINDIKPAQRRLEAIDFILKEYIELLDEDTIKELNEKKAESVILPMLEVAFPLKRHARREKKIEDLETEMQRLMEDKDEIDEEIEELQKEIDAFAVVEPPPKPKRQQAASAAPRVRKAKAVVEKPAFTLDIPEVIVWGQLPPDAQTHS